MKGALFPDESFKYPLYRQPDDLIRIDLSLFNEKFKGENIIARIEGKKVLPYYSRYQIEAERVLKGKNLEIDVRNRLKPNAAKEKSGYAGTGAGKGRRFDRAPDRVAGNTQQGLPSAYDKDLQEDKVPVFESSTTLQAMLPVIAGLLRTLTIRSEAMRQALDPALLATDLADYLVKRGIPFREAHGLIGQAVRQAHTLGLRLDQLSLADLQSISATLSGC